MIGYAAASGMVDERAVVLFAILFLWQFPHFYSIAWLYREDYSRAGIKMLPVVDPNRLADGPPDPRVRVAVRSPSAQRRAIYT